MVVATGRQALAVPFLLSPPAAAEIEAWMGAGPLAYLNVFEKGAGSSNVTFHAAVDGRGPTITLMEATDERGNRWILGGYNPRSWQSVPPHLDGWSISQTDAERTAFIFNLTAGVVRRQKLNGDPFGPLGRYQTNNLSDYGPVFGAGGDLFVLNNFLQAYEYPYSYGPSTNANGDEGLVPNYTGYNFLTVGALEVYTFEAAAVPEPAPMMLVGAGLAALWLGASRRSRRG